MRNVTKPDLQWYNKGMTPPILPNSNTKISQICMFPFLVITLLSVQLYLQPDLTGESRHTSNGIGIFCHTHAQYIYIYIHLYTDTYISDGIVGLSSFLSLMSLTWQITKSIINCNVWPLTLSEKRQLRFDSWHQASLSAPQWVVPGCAQAPVPQRLETTPWLQARQKQLLR